MFDKYTGFISAYLGDFVFENSAMRGPELFMSSFRQLCSSVKVFVVQSKSWLYTVYVNAIKRPGKHILMLYNFYHLQKFLFSFPGFLSHVDSICQSV